MNSAHSSVVSIGKSRTFLGLEISGLSDNTQFAILFGSLLFFMCLYGLFQEIVVYDWFARKLSIFTAGLHFLGCVICAVFLHIVSADSLSNGLKSLVHAPRAPLSSYFVLCSLKVEQSNVYTCLVFLPYWLFLGGYSTFHKFKYAAHQFPHQDPPESVPACGDNVIGIWNSRQAIFWYRDIVRSGAHCRPGRLSPRRRARCAGRHGHRLSVRFHKFNQLRTHPNDARALVYSILRKFVRNAVKHISWVVFDNSCSHCSERRDGSWHSCAADFINNISHNVSNWILYFCLHGYKQQHRNNHSLWGFDEWHM